MELSPKVQPQHEAQWREILTYGPRGLLTRGPLGYRIMRWVLRRLPPATQPRCKHCYVPFSGVVGTMVGALGFAPSRKNPSMCAY